MLVTGRDTHPFKSVPNRFINETKLFKIVSNRFINGVKIKMSN